MAKPILLLPLMYPAPLIPFTQGSSDWWIKRAVPRNSLKNTKPFKKIPSPDKLFLFILRFLSIRFQKGGFLLKSKKHLKRRQALTRLRRDMALWRRDMALWRQNIRLINLDGFRVKSFALRASIFKPDGYKNS